jgi:hypothetical protein
MKQLVFYVPHSHLEAVKEALFAAGAGRIGNYDRCAWQTEGLGQYRPLPGSKPFLGQESQTEEVREWKVELVCDEAQLPAALAALKKVHPYETPAFFVHG